MKKSHKKIVLASDALFTMSTLGRIWLLQQMRGKQSKCAIPIRNRISARPTAGAPPGGRGNLPPSFPIHYYRRWPAGQSYSRGNCSEWTKIDAIEETLMVASPPSPQPPALPLLQSRRSSRSFRNLVFRSTSTKLQTWLHFCSLQGTYKPLRTWSMWCLFTKFVTLSTWLKQTPLHVHV